MGPRSATHQSRQGNRIRRLERGVGVCGTPEALDGKILRLGVGDTWAGAGSQLHHQRPVVVSRVPVVLATVRLNFE